MYSLYAYYNSRLVDILPKSNNLQYTSDKDNLAIEMTFDSIYSLDIGTQIALKNDTDVVVAGTIIEKDQKKFVNTYTVMDFAFYLNKSKTAIQFNNVTANTAIKMLLDGFNIQYNIADITTNINKTFRGDAISDIIDSILEIARLDSGTVYVRYMDAYTLNIQPLDHLKITPTILIDKDITYTTSIEDMKNKVIVSETGVTLATAEDDTSISKYGLLQDVYKVSKKNASQANNIAQNYLSQNNRILEELTFDAVGISGADDILANRMIYIDIPSFGISDWIRIATAQHTITNNMHKISITLDNSLDNMISDDDESDEDGEDE
jgi:hypothetical protein